MAISSRAPKVDMVRQRVAAKPRAAQANDDAGETRQRQCRSMHLQTGIQAQPNYEYFPGADGVAHA